MTLEEIKDLIKSGELESNSEVIAKGELHHSSGQATEYSIYHGWDIASSLECDQLWGKSNIELFEYIEKQEYSEEELDKVLASIQTEDHHWNWFKKSIGTIAEEYEWFYLYADNKPQAACVIYHPKDSALDESKIFYVEFLAVAPWNRDCLVRKREYLNVGSIVLFAALKYSVENLGLSPGFSLHSLPQASGYYKKLKMTNVEEKNKESLLYFELPEAEAVKLLEAV